MEDLSTAFLVDRYELTMVDALLSSGIAHRKAVFELFARKLPTGRQYGVVAGTQRAIEAVQNFRFSEEQCAWLEQESIVSAEAIEYLRNFAFSGTITGYREGELYFPYSPILTVEATFAEACLLETVLLSIYNADSAVASAAARMVQAAKGKPVYELGSRRTHEIAAVSATRAAYVAGFAATSNLKAGLKYGIPTMGTAAHAFTLAHPTERAAFETQVAALGEKTTLLVDTYNIAEGIRTAVEVAGPRLGGIRIDSGDLYEETTKARALLDSLGAKETKIILSSDIDEYIIDELMDRDIPVDGIGAGTKVVTGSGHPTAGMVYKLVAIADEMGAMQSVAKKSSEKISVGGRKWAWRWTDSNGFAYREKIIVNNSPLYAPQYVNTPEARTLQTVFIVDGVVNSMPTLEEIREHHRFAISQLPGFSRSVAAGTPSVNTEF